MKALYNQIYLKNIKLFFDCFKYAHKFERNFYSLIINNIIRSIYLTDKEKEIIIKAIENNKKINLTKYYNNSNYKGENESNFMSINLKKKKFN